MVHWVANHEMKGRVVHMPDDENIVMVELMEEMDGEMQPSGYTLTAGYMDVRMDDMSMDEHMEGDKYYAIGPDENPDDEPKYPINNCNDAKDAWNLRGAGDYDIEQSTLEERIKDRAQELDCELPSTANMEDDSAVTEQYNTDYYTNRDTKMTDKNTFDISVSVDRDSVTVDSLADQFDAVADLKAEYDALQSTLDQMRDEMDLDADECPCDHVADLKAKADEADDLRAELDEYRQSEKEDRLDRLSELNADRDEWEDENLDEIEAEIDRREDIFKDIDFSVKNADGGDGEESDSSSTRRGKRRFGRGYNA